MDAATIVAAALAVVAENSRDAAMLDLLQERERLAMAVADRDSYLAQRHFVVSAQVELPGRLMPWRAAFRQRHNDFLDAHAAMRAAVTALRSGDVDVALSSLTDEVGSDSVEDEEMDVSEADATDGETEEEEEAEEDAEVEPS